MYKGSILYTTDPYNIRVNFMYVGVAWVCPWLIALEGEYIRLIVLYVLRLTIIVTKYEDLWYIRLIPCK